MLHKCRLLHVVEPFFAFQYPGLGYNVQKKRTSPKLSIFSFLQHELHFLECHWIQLPFVNEEEHWEIFLSGIYDWYEHSTCSGSMTFICSILPHGPSGNRELSVQQSKVKSCNLYVSWRQFDVVRNNIGSGKTSFRYVLKSSKLAKHF